MKDGQEIQNNLTTLEEIITSQPNYYSIKYGLTPEFFENILFHESSLKEKFDVQIFFELLNLYSNAIEYYESLNDKKFIIYNQALNYLFDLPEAKKFMEGKDLAKIYRKKELIAKFKQCEKIVTEEKVKLFIEKRINEENIMNSINNLYNSDINKQKKNFFKILEEKRNKFKNKKQQKEEEKNQNENKNNDLIKNDKKENENINEIKEEKFEDEFKLGGVDAIMNIDYEEKNKEKEDGNEMKFNFDDVKEFVNNAIEESKQNNKKNDDNDKKININYKLELKQSIKLTNKSRFSEKIDNNFDEYFKSYYNFFINNNIDSIINDVEEYSVEEIRKLRKSEIELSDQIKDFESLMEDKNCEENYKNEVKNMIKDLKEKQNQNIENVLNDINSYSKQLDKKYIINNSLFKEKFKLDTTKLLNTFIFK